MKIDSLRDYDKGLNRLKEIVEKLSDENISLNDNIKLYEEGINLYNKLKKILDKTKTKIIEIDVEDNNLTNGENNILLEGQDLSFLDTFGDE